MGMTNAERQRRYIARLKERANAGVNKPGASSRRIRELETALAHERKRRVAAEAKLDEAMKLFTEWKKDRDKAR